MEPGYEQVAALPPVAVRLSGFFCVGYSHHGGLACRVAPAKKQKGGKQQQKGGKQGGKGGNAEANKTSEEIRELRADKAAQLRTLGQNPFAYGFERTATAQELQEQYKSLPNGEEAGEDVSVAIAGRVLARRVMGKLAFATVRDGSGTIQLYVDRSRLAGGADGMKLLKNLVDTGDFVGVRGGLRRTDKGELSVVADTIEVRPLQFSPVHRRRAVSPGTLPAARRPAAAKLTQPPHRRHRSTWCTTAMQRRMQVLTKSHRQLPDKFHGLTDVEKRYRQRYVDMIANPDVLDTFRARSLVISTLRRTLEADGFLEAETPVRLPPRLPPMPPSALGRRVVPAVRASTGEQHQHVCRCLRARTHSDLLGRFLNRWPEGPMRGRSRRTTTLSSGTSHCASQQSCTSSASWSAVSSASSKSAAFSATRVSRRGTTRSSRRWSSTRRILTMWA